MDQVHEKSESKDVSDLLQELLKGQEAILLRLERLEERVRALQEKRK